MLCSGCGKFFLFFGQSNFLYKETLYLYLLLLILSETKYSKLFSPTAIGPILVLILKMVEYIDSKEGTIPCRMTSH